MIQEHSLYKNRLEDGTVFSQFRPCYNLNTGEVIAREAIICCSEEEMEPARGEKYSSAMSLEVQAVDELCRMWKEKQEIFSQPILIRLSMETIQNPYCLYDMVLSMKHYAVTANAIHIILKSTVQSLSEYNIKKGISFLRLNKLEADCFYVGDSLRLPAVCTEMGIKKIYLEKKLYQEAMRHSDIAKMFSDLVQTANKLGIEAICCNVERAEELRFIKAAGVSCAYGDFFTF